MSSTWSKFDSTAPHPRPRPLSPLPPRCPLGASGVSWHREEGSFDSWVGVLVLLESDSLAASLRLYLQAVRQPQRGGTFLTAYLHHVATVLLTHLCLSLFTK